MLAAASGNTLTIWDILSGGRVLQAVSAHSKTITSLSTDGDGRHLLSASLDRMVKVYELGSYKVCLVPPCAKREMLVVRPRVACLLRLGV